MSELERKASVRMLWAKAMYDGEPVQISIVNGKATIRIAGLFDLRVPGKFRDGDIEQVVEAHRKRMAQINQAFEELPEDWERPCANTMDDCAQFPDIDLPEPDESDHQVIYLSEVRRHD